MDGNAQSLVTLKISDHVAAISLDRPAKRNALNDAMLRELLQTIVKVEADDGVRVLVLRGEGDHFCAGVDLAEKLAVRGSQGAVDYELLLEVFHRLEHVRCPTIAVLRGTSVAGGWELGLHCDVRMAAPDSKFGMPLVRLGLVAPYPAMLRLIRIGGVSAATDLLLSGSLIDGARAYALGFVTHLVHGDTLDTAAVDYATGVSQLAPLAVRETKRVLAHLSAAPPPSAYASFDQARRQVTAGADTVEGLRAFVERRSPRFTGR